MKKYFQLRTEMRMKAVMFIMRYRIAALCSQRLMIALEYNLGPEVIKNDINRA